MIFIDRSKFTPETDWLNKADVVTQKLLAASSKDIIHKIIDNNQKLWGELKNVLLLLSNNKCWYSESKENYSYLHVDHFRPKKAAFGLDNNDYGGYWWLAFDWTNYRICGSVGNVSKKDKFGVFRNKANNPNDIWQDETIYLLDPCHRYDPLKITFNSNGEAMSLYKDGWHFKQAQYTIDTLKLNFKHLKEARKKIWVKCSNLIEEIQKFLDEENKNSSATRRGQIEEKLKQIKELIKPTSEFSGIARACLKSTGVDWAMGIAA